MPSRAGASALLVSVVLVAATAASADSPREQSRAAFMRGVSESHQGHFTAARDAFLEAYKLYAHPSILLNLGIARWHTGEYVQAEQDLARFLSDDGGASDEEIANARAALLATRQHLGVVRLRIAPDGAKATLDGQRVALVPGSFAEVRAVVGPAVLVVEAGGYEAERRTLVVEHDSPSTVDLALKPLAGGAPPPAAGEVAAPDRHTRRLLGYGALGVAAVTATVATVAGFRAIALAHDYNTAGSGSFQDPSTKSTGIAFRTTSDVLFATTLVAAGVGVYWLVFPLKSSSSTAKSTSLTIRPGGFTLEGVF
jgi:hypothetical protein